MEPANVAIFRTACQWTLHWASWIQITSSHPISFRINFYPHSDMPRSVRRSLLCKFSNYFICIFNLSSILHTCPAHAILLDFIILISSKDYKLWRFLLCTFLNLLNIISILLHENSHVFISDTLHFGWHFKNITVDNHGLETYWFSMTEIVFSA
jgi:hypothetical protein